MKKNPRRTLIIADMKKDMPPGARIDGIGLHELVKLPVTFTDFDNVNFNKREIDFADPDDIFIDALLAGCKESEALEKKQKAKKNG